MSKIIHGFVTVVMGLCLVLYAAPVHAAAAASKGTKNKDTAYALLRVITYGFTLQNSTNQVVKNVEFWTYAPATQTATQRCDRIETSHPCEVLKDDMGNQVLHFAMGDVAPSATKIVRIWAYLNVSITARPIKVTNYAPYLACQKYIECDAPEIIRTARRLAAPSPFGTVKKIFAWTSDNIRYSGFSPNDRGAVYALEKQEGDCTEFSDLFVALCRANKIPARCMSGYVYQGQPGMEPSRYHDWAEFYHDGAWRMADPQQKVFMRDQADYIVMRISGCPVGNRVANFNRYRCSGEGIKVTMNG